MIYSVPVDAPPNFNLFSSIRDLRTYLATHHGIPDEAVAQVFFWKNRIDFSLKKGSFDEERFSMCD